MVEDRYDESEQEDDIEVDDDWRSDEEEDREDDMSEEIDWFERRKRLKRAPSLPHRVLQPSRRSKLGLGRRSRVGLLKRHKPLVNKSFDTNRTSKSIAARNFNSDGQIKITAPVIRPDHVYEEDMWTMGQPEDVDEYDMPHDFFQYKDSGAGVAVYVVDDGCDFSHPVSTLTNLFTAQPPLLISRMFVLNGNDRSLKAWILTNGSSRRVGLPSRGQA